YIVTAVVGDPLTFETDVADVRRPVRQKVNIVSDQALGFVGAEDDISSLAPMGAGDRSLPSPPPMHRRAKGAMAAPAPVAATPLESRGVEPRAKTAIDVQASECGDFAAFTAKTPINIGANRSTPVQLFRQDVEGEVFLLYNQSKDAHRPFRAVKFKNTTPHS